MNACPLIVNLYMENIHSFLNFFKKLYGLFSEEIKLGIFLFF